MVQEGDIEEHALNSSHRKYFQKTLEDDALGKTKVVRRISMNIKTT